MGKFTQNFILLVSCAAQGMFSPSNCNYYISVVVQSQPHLKGNKLKTPDTVVLHNLSPKLASLNLIFLKMLFCKQAICFITHGWVSHMNCSLCLKFPIHSGPL